jgi:hypothetical protein
MIVPIEITQTEHGYTAVVTPIPIAIVLPTAEHRGVTDAWETTKAMTREDLRAKLLELGAHPLDIEDAFHQSDPNWTPPYEDPERFRRRTAGYIPLPPRLPEADSVGRGQQPDDAPTRD